MWYKTAMVVALAAICTGCMTAEDLRCRGRGAMPVLRLRREERCFRRMSAAHRSRAPRGPEKRVGFRSLGPAGDSSSGHHPATAHCGVSLIFLSGS